MYLLGIESSCDDTSVAVCKDGHIISNVVSSQLKHSIHGGVVPELASRLHTKNISVVTREALDRANIEATDLEAIAFTAGPGLSGSLMVGTSFAKGMALSLGLPMIEVDHMVGHILSLFLEEPKPKLPMLCLIVSGGHTQLVLALDYLEHLVVGKTLDDAAGEAFDKIAKLLGFEYPGGPLIDKNSKDGNIHFLPLPTPKVPGLDFSFSGLKTAFLYALKKKLESDPQYINNHLSDLCASIQHKIVQYLLDKMFEAAHQYDIRQLGIVGGVSANSYLRAQFQSRCITEKVRGFIPRFEYCTDNAAMIAFAGYKLWQGKKFTSHFTECYANTKNSSRPNAIKNP